MSNKRNKERIRKILLEGGIMTTGEIFDKLNNNVISTSGLNPDGTRLLYRSRRYDTVSMNQLCNLMRVVANKHSFCEDNKQVTWRIKEVKNNVVDRKIQAE